MLPLKFFLTQNNESEDRKLHQHHKAMSQKYEAKFLLLFEKSIVSIGNFKVG
jgi:hypothetical protein